MIEPSDSIQPSEPHPVPHIVYGNGADPDVAINPHDEAQTMRELNISDLKISNTTVYVDPHSRIQAFGTHYPDWLARIRFAFVPELRDVKGDIVRLSTTMKGKPRTAEEINHANVHELEHVAQDDRHDRKVTEGHIAIWGLAAAGAAIGNRLGRNKVSKTAGTVLGAALGHSVGYLIAPHERQARQRARQVTSTAVTRKQHS